MAGLASHTKGAQELDALAAVLPMAAADRYAEVLTDADIATLKHLADTGMGANTLRALASDLAYLEAWSQAATARMAAGGGGSRSPRRWRSAAGCSGGSGGG